MVTSYREAEPTRVPQGESIYIGHSSKPELIYLHLANRHGLITGAAGTGKTVTVQGLVENFSDRGVPVFCVDVKGDLTGLAAAGDSRPWIEERAERIQYRRELRAYPVIFWDVFGKRGHLMRSTVATVDAPRMALLMALDKRRAETLDAILRIAEDEELPVLDLKDLRAVLADLSQRVHQLTLRYGHVSKNAIESIQFAVFNGEQQYADHFFGEPALDISDLMRVTQGRGFVSLLAAGALVSSPRLYATLTLSLLSLLSDELPTIGQVERPKLVLVLDEADLIFRDLSEAMLQKVEDTLSLLGSKGVGVYFTAPHPGDVPTRIAKVLGHRIHHATPWFTPKEQRSMRSAIRTLRHNPKFDTLQTIKDLGAGEALVSTLDSELRPTPLEHTLVKVPNSRVGPLTDSEREAVIVTSPLHSRYEAVVDRRSAYEILRSRLKGGRSTASGLESAVERGALGGVRRRTWGDGC